MVDLYLFKTALRDLARPKRLFIAVAMALMPAGLALLWRVTAREDFDSFDVYNTISPLLVYGFLLVILAVVFATGVVTQDIEQKTIVYMLTRPVPRWRIILMKFAACLTGIVLTTTVATGLLAAACFLGGDPQVSALVRVQDVKDPTSLVTRIKTDADPVATYLHERMGRRMRNFLGRWNPERPLPDRLLNNVVRQVNSSLRDNQAFYTPERFEGVALRPETEQLLAKKPTGRERTQLNRLLLEEAFAGEVMPRKSSTVSPRTDVAVLAIGAAAYGAVFLLLATLINRPLMIGLMFVFGWESWVPNMPGRFQLVSIMSYLRTLSPHARPPAEVVDILQFLSGSNQDAISSRSAWTTLIVVTLVALMAALVVFSQREYVPREDAE